MSDLYEIHWDGADCTIRFIVPEVRDVNALDEAEKHLVELVDTGRPAQLVVDISEVQFLNSRAVGMLVALNRTFQSTGGDMLTLKGAGEPLLELLRLTRIDKTMRLV